MPRKKRAIKGNAPKPVERPDEDPLISKGRELLRKGEGFLETYDSKGAAPALEEAYALFTKAGAGLEDRIDIIVSLANLHILEGDFDKAEAMVLEAMKLIGKASVPTALKGRANYMHGWVLLKKGDFEASLIYLERALSLFEAAKKKLWIAITCRNIGNNYLERHLFSKGIVHYNRALKLFKELGRESELWIIHHNVGLAVGEQGNYKEAIKRMELVLKYVDSPESSRLSALCHSNLGYLYLRMGLFDLAVQHYDEGLQKSNKAGDSAFGSYSMMGKMQALVGKGDIENANRLMKELFKPLMASKSNDIMGIALRTRGVINRERGEFKKAEDDFELAERFLTAGHYQITLSALYIEWGRTVAKAGDKKRAKDIFSKAGAIYKELNLPLRQKELDRAMRECGL